MTHTNLKQNFPGDYIYGYVSYNPKITGNLHFMQFESFKCMNRLHIYNYVSQNRYTKYTVKILLTQLVAI